VCTVSAAETAGRYPMNGKTRRCREDVKRLSGEMQNEGQKGESKLKKFDRSMDC